MMAVAMSIDILRFALIFIISIFGFCVAMYSLSRNQGVYGFGTKQQTFITMFSAAFGNYETNFAESFPDFDDRFRSLSIAIELVYVVFTAVLLLNLVIARMSATHDKIDKIAFEEWRFLRATDLLNVILIEERSPFGMLPAPFNIICVMIAVCFDYPRLFYYQYKLLRSSCYENDEDKPDTINMICVSSTISDWTIALFMSFIAPLCELLRYSITSLQSENNSSIEMLKVFVFFPFIYPLYVIALLIRGIYKLNRVTIGKKIIHLRICHDVISIPTQQNGKDDEVYFELKILRVYNLPSNMKSSNVLVRVQLQDMVLHTGECFKEEKTDSFLFNNTILKFPLGRISISDDMTVSVSIINKSLASEGFEVVGHCNISNDDMKLWIANGRYEGKIEIPKSKIAIQVVAITSLKATQFHLNDNKPLQDHESTKIYNIISDSHSYKSHVKDRVSTQIYIISNIYLLP
jgi:hypothetical protein